MVNSVHHARTFQFTIFNYHVYRHAHIIMSIYMTFIVSIDTNMNMKKNLHKGYCVYRHKDYYVYRYNECCVYRHEKKKLT